MIDVIQAYKEYFIKKRKALPRAVRGVFNRVILKKPHLRVAEIATTFICNSKCIMCSCTKFCDYEKEKNRMTVFEYKSLGKQLDELGCVSVNVTGGEPLIRKDIADVIVALNPKNKIINLITNGINLTRDKVKIYSLLGVDSIIVSLESTCAQENDKIRGYDGHFQVVMDAIKWAKDEKVKFGISLTLGDFNFQKIQELIQFAKDKSIFLCIAHGGSVGNWSNNSSIYLSEKNANEILSMIKQHKQMKIDFSTNLNLRPGCPAMVEKIYITPYGDILPCTFIPISYGNLREESLASIWKRMIWFHKKNASSKTLCLRSYDRKFIENFLVPIKDRDQPVRIDKHPYFAEHKGASWDR